jgi:hypothetical protein
MPLRYLAPRPSNSKSLPPAASLSICAAAVSRPPTVRQADDQQLRIRNVPSRPHVNS